MKVCLIEAVNFAGAGGTGAGGSGVGGGGSSETSEFATSISDELAKSSFLFIVS